MEKLIAILATRNPDDEGSLAETIGLEEIYPIDATIEIGLVISTAQPAARAHPS